MVTRSNLVFSAAAFKRIQNLVYRNITNIRVEEWANVVWVWMPGYCRFWSKAVFRSHFVQWRKQQAKLLRVAAWSNSENNDRYIVKNPKKETSYVVTTQRDKIRCHCEDYENQVHYLGKACCKHGYAVLAHLGYDSLANWIDRQ